MLSTRFDEDEKLFYFTSFSFYFKSVFFFLFVLFIFVCFILRMFSIGKKTMFFLIFLFPFFFFFVFLFFSDDVDSIENPFPLTRDTRFATIQLETSIRSESEKELKNKRV